MSKIALTPNASGTGTLTVAAPNTNTDRTLTLPDVTTTLVGTDATQTLTNKTLTAPTLTGVASIGSGSGVYANNADMRLETATGRGWRMGTTSSASTLGYFYIQGTTDNFSASFIDSLNIDASGNVGIGTTSPPSQLTVSGTGQLVAALTDAGTRTGSIQINSTSGASGAGGALLFSGTAANGATSQWAIKSLLNDGTANGNSVLVFSGRSGTSDTTLTERMRITPDGLVQVNGSTTGTSQVAILKNNPSGYNSANLELSGSAGDVVLGFHAAGATAACIDHVRGGSGVRVLTLTRGGYAPIAASAFNVNSDYRLKENVQPLVGALDRLSTLPVYRFSFIKDSMMYADGALVDGFMAHEAASAVPEAVTGDKDAVDTEGKPVYQVVDYGKYVPLLVAAIQEQQQMIQALQADIAALKGV